MGLCVATAAVSCSDGLVEDINKLPVGGEDSDMISFVVANNNTTRGGSFGNRPCGGAYLHSANNADSLYLKMEVADIDDALSTRAAEISDANLPNRLNMTCRIRKQNSDYSFYFENTAFEHNGDVWSSTPAYYWLNNDDNFNFYGYYAPADAKGVDYISGSSSNGYTPSLDYTVQPDVNDHFDLSYSDYADYEYIASSNVKVPLSMKHALAKIAFKTGTGMKAGTIKGVSIKNIVNKANLNLEAGNWTSTTSIGDCTLSGLSVSTEDTPITTDGNHFYVLPGCTGATSTLEIVFRPEGADKDEVYFTTIDNADWKAGKQYLYTITLTPELEIDLVPETVDAHYVIAKAHINADGLTGNKKWELTVSANDGAKVSVVSELSDYQKQGFWIDQIITDPNATSGESARGSEVLTGSTSQDVYIFIPENASENSERTITLSLNMKGSTGSAIDEKSFQQYHPAWVGNFGWEQTDDNKEAQFGFNWNKVVYYGYLYTAALWGNSTYKKTCQTIIDENSAGEYASVETYDYPGLRMRYCIKIDYSKGALNNLGENSSDDGAFNTKQLYKVAGTSTTGEFERVVATTKKTEAGHESEPTFRLGDGTGGEAPAPSGDNSPETPAIGECLKKNRYYLLKTISADNDVTYSPIIKETDIRWYLPAVNQFTKLPADNSVVDAINPIECWSSTTYKSNQTKAYIGDKTLYPRLNTKKIRACRNKN